MTDALIARALEKQRLVLRSAALRVRLARDVERLAPGFGVADRCRDVYVWVRQRRLWLAAAGGLLIASQPRRLWRWTQRAYAGWKIWNRVRQLLIRR